VIDVLSALLCVLFWTSKDFSYSNPIMMSDPVF
jgi:hypothetical protein